MIQFIIPGSPKGKGRPRATKTSVMYTPKDTASYENWVKCCFVNSGCEKIAGNVPLQAEIAVLYPIPKSATKNAAQDMLSGRLLPTKKPDCDNIMKIIFDALNGIAYDDDKQIVIVWFTKRYTASEPCVRVKIFEVNTPQ